MKKLFLLRALAMAICIIMTASLLAGCGGKASNGEKATWTSTYTDDNGDVYVSLMNGNKVKVGSEDDDEYSYSILLPDGKYVMKFQLDDLLYSYPGFTISYLNVKNGKTIEINGGEECNVIWSGNTCMVYSTDDDGTEKTYIQFIEGKKVCIGDSDKDECDFVYANNGSLFPLGAFAFYWQEKEAIYTLTDDDKEPKKQIFIDADSEPEILAVSDDGQRIVWSDNDGNTNLTVDGKTVTVFDDEYSQSGVTAYFDQSGKNTVITHSSDNTILFFNGTNKPKDISQSKRLRGVYTETGSFEDSTASKLNGIYTVLSDANSWNDYYTDYYTDSVKSDLYYVDMNGERTRVVSEALSFEIANGIIVYTTDEGLYYAKLSKGELKDKQKIAKGVNSFKLSSDGKFIEYEKETGYYLYSLEKNDSEKICSGVKDIVWAIDKSGIVFYIDSSDSTLYRYEYGKGSTKIFDDVYELQGGYQSGNVMSGSFDFLRNNGDGTYDLYYYNGKTAKKVIPNIVSNISY